MANFFVFMLTGVFIGLVLYFSFRIIKYFINKKKIKEDKHTIDQFCLYIL